MKKHRIDRARLLSDCSETALEEIALAVKQYCNHRYDVLAETVMFSLGQRADKPQLLDFPTWCESQGLCHDDVIGQIVRLLMFGDVSHE